MLNGKSSPKDAALIALKRAEQEIDPTVMAALIGIAPAPLIEKLAVVAALISIATKYVSMIDELVRPRRVRKEKGELPL